MAELFAAGAFEGMALPLAVGGVTLAALPDTPRVSVAPFAGCRETVSAVLTERTGTGLTEPGRASHGVIWNGLGQWLLEGSEAREVASWLSGLAAVTDQSDAWAAMAMNSGVARAVLARLVPLDLDAAVFPLGSAARSMLRHVPLLIVAQEANFEMLVPRSYARTAVRDLTAAMTAVAARAELGVSYSGGSRDHGIPPVAI